MKSSLKSLLRQSAPISRSGALSDIQPGMLLDFQGDFYRYEDQEYSLLDLFDYSTTTPRTFVNSVGMLQWGCMDLTDGTATTQSLTVPSGETLKVHMTGSGSVTLSGAGTGVVTEGNPVQVVAGSGSLTLAVSGTVDHMWAYRNSLGGMAEVPLAYRGLASEPTYLANDTGTARFLPRFNHHAWDGLQWVNKGLRWESAPATNLLLNSATLSTQSVAVSAQDYTLSFTGTGTVTLSGAATGSLVGTGTGEQNRVNLTFTATAGTLTATVTGDVANADLVAGKLPRSHIPTYGATQTGTAETLETKSGKIPWPSGSVGSRYLALSISGEVSYANNSTFDEVIFFEQVADASNRLSLNLDTVAGSGGLDAFFLSAGTNSRSNENSSYSEGLNVPFRVAAIYSDVEVQAALDGTTLELTAASANLPDLSAAPLKIATKFNGTICKISVPLGDIGQTGLEQATS